ncbi:MAG: glycoside hydrolase family 172 protein, partial [Verrucomicrobiota bacterium]
MSEKESGLVEQVLDVWKNLDRQFPSMDEASHDRQVFVLAPGQRHDFVDVRGSGMLASCWLRPIWPEGISEVERARILRELSLEWTWDDAPEPSVRVPFGDFFGNAFHPRRFSSLPLGKIGDRYITRFPMPYNKSARATIVNEGNTELSFESGYGAALLFYGQPIRYFHAGWNGGASKRPGRPHQVLNTTGKGHLVGCYLNAISATDSWFILEGDERIFVDGRKKPVVHGTGLEDFFNGAWYYTGLSDLPLCGLLEKAAMRTDQYRFLLADRLPFASSLAFDFEFGDRNASPGYISSVAYWYQDQPIAAPELPPVGERFYDTRSMDPKVIMSELFELEREGLYEEARQRCLAHNEQFPESADRDLFDLRSAVYLE